MPSASLVQKLATGSWSIRRRYRSALSLRGCLVMLQVREDRGSVLEGGRRVRRPVGSRWGSGLDRPTRITEAGQGGGHSKRRGDPRVGEWPGRRQCRGRFFVRYRLARDRIAGARRRSRSRSLPSRGRHPCSRLPAGPTERGIDEWTELLPTPCPAPAAGCLEHLRVPWAPKPTHKASL